jgi:hypothetical protein
MKTTALLCLQHWQIDQLLEGLLDERDRARRIERIVELIERVIAHLAVKKNVLYPVVDDTSASALVESRHGCTAALRALHALAVAATDDRSWAARARALRETLDDLAQKDEGLAVALEASIAPAVAELLGGEAERYHAACMYARLLLQGGGLAPSARRPARRERDGAQERTLHDPSATRYRFAGHVSRSARTQRSSL